MVQSLSVDIEARSLFLEEEVKGLGSHGSYISPNDFSPGSYSVDGYLWFLRREVPDFYHHSQEFHNQSFGI